MFGSQRDIFPRRRALSGKITSLDGIDLKTLLTSLVVLPGMYGDMQNESIVVPKPQEEQQKKPQKASVPTDEKEKSEQSTTGQEKIALKACQTMST